MGPWWPRPPPLLPGVRYSAPIRPSCQISTAFIREPSILRNRSSYNIILWPTGDITHFPGERISQLNQIWIISNKMLIVLCLRQCFVSHLRSFINFFPRLSSFMVFLFKRSSMFRILNLNTPQGCLLERILNLRCFELQTTVTTG